ncbi:hypothetical protein Droror1_Dr00003635 [Drosera rotundifolia]
MQLEPPAFSTFLRYRRRRCHHPTTTTNPPPSHATVATTRPRHHPRNPLIKSTTTTTYLPKACQIHALILTSIPIYSQTPFVYNHVISMYVRSGSLSDARKVFDKMRVRNVISYNSMIAAYAREYGCVGLGFEVVLGIGFWGCVFMEWL